MLSASGATELGERVLELLEESVALDISVMWGVAGAVTDIEVLVLYVVGVPMGVFFSVLGDVLMHVGVSIVCVSEVCGCEWQYFPEERVLPLVTVGSSPM